MISNPKYYFVKFASIAFVTIFINSANAETWYGTAFAIGDGYTYITNHHVASDATTICFRTPNGTAARAKVINSDKSDDLAILRANVYSQPLPLGTYQDIKKGMNILTMGYPVPSIMGLESKVTEGLVNSLSGAGNDTRRIQISAPIQPGNSGGPLLDEYGNVIGVVVSRLGKKFTELTGQYADSVGYAINIARLRALIETTPILPNHIKYNQPKTLIQKTKLVSQIEGSVMLVVASDKKDNCGESTDIEIPDFGVTPKTKSQIEKEKREFDRLAQLRIEEEKREKIKLQNELEAQKKIAEAKEKQQIEEKRKLQSNIENALQNISPFWKSIEKSPSYGLYKILNPTEIVTPLNQSASPEKAEAALKNYMRYTDDKFKNIGNSVEKYTHSGLTKNGKLSQIDKDYSYAAISLSAPIPPDTELLLIGKEGIWASFKISKIVGNKLSFEFDKKFNSLINETSEIYIVNK